VINWISDQSKHLNLALDHLIRRVKELLGNWRTFLIATPIVH
jgi:hypothetical protein